MDRGQDGDGYVLNADTSNVQSSAQNFGYADVALPIANISENVII